MKNITILITIAILLISSQAYADEVDLDVKKAIENATSNEEKVDILYSSGKKLTLNNYVLNKKVAIDSPNKITAEQGGQFVPQLDEFLDLYLDFIDQGMKPIEAIMMTHVSPQAIELVKQYQETKK